MFNPNVGKMAGGNPASQSSLRSNQEVTGFQNSVQTAGRPLTSMPVSTSEAGKKITDLLFRPNARQMTVGQAASLVQNRQQAEIVKEVKTKLEGLGASPEMIANTDTMFDSKVDVGIPCYLPEQR